MSRRDRPVEWFVLEPFVLLSRNSHVYAVMGELLKINPIPFTAWVGTTL